MFDIDVFGLFLIEKGEFGPQVREVESGYFLVQLTTEFVDLGLVFAGVLPQLDLGHHLVGETVAHDKTGVSGGTPKIHQSAFCENDYAFAARELPSCDHVFDNLFLDAGYFLEASHVDFIVKMT